MITVGIGSGHSGGRCTLSLITSVGAHVSKVEKSRKIEMYRVISKATHNDADDNDDGRDYLPGNHVSPACGIRALWTFVWLFAGMRALMR